MAPLRSQGWSPDGKHIASAGSEGQLRVWNTTSGRTRFTGSAIHEQLGYVARAPDTSSIIACGGQMGHFRAWNAKNGQDEYLSGGEGPHEPITALAFSPADASSKETESRKAVKRERREDDDTQQPGIL
jgi:WD40 repeat protein